MISPAQDTVHILQSRSSIKIFGLEVQIWNEGQVGLLW